MKTSNEPIKKKNHITPVCLIKQWAVEGTGKHKGRLGVHVYETTKKKFSFSSASGTPFSFAIEHYFYVPKIGDTRTNVVEDWLSGIEGTLSFFIQQITNNVNEKPLLYNPESWTKFLLAIFSLKNRTKYDINKQKEFLINNPIYKEKIATDGTTDVDILVLENFINATTFDANAYGNCQVIICKAKTGEFILGDRPFFFEILDGHSYLVLSPHFCSQIPVNLKL